MAWASFVGLAAPFLLVLLVLAVWMPTILSHYSHDQPKLVHSYPPIDDKYVLTFVESAASCDAWADENLVENIYVATVDTSYGIQEVPHDGSPTDDELIRRAVAQGRGVSELYECGVSHPSDKCEAIFDQCKKAEGESLGVRVHKAVFLSPSIEGGERQLSWIVMASDDYPVESWLKANQKLTFVKFVTNYVDWAENLLLPQAFVFSLVLIVLNYLMTGAFRLRPWVTDFDGG